MPLQAVAQAILDFMSVPKDNPALVTAARRAFSRQMPMMYFILLSSTWALAYTHWGHAPDWLAFGVPVGLTAVSALRIWQWWRASRDDMGVDEAVRHLRRTNILSVTLAAAFTAWALALFPYGDAYLQSHVAFYMAITVIACIVSLMHLRSAAVIVTVVVIGSFVLFFPATGQPTFTAIAVNLVLVAIGLLTMLMVNYRNFSRMIAAQQETEALSNDNLRLANLDSLTDLPNRRACFARLEQELTAAATAGRKLAFGIVDLDGFKPVNDVYGHSTGDKLLVMVSQRLTEAVSSREIFVARLGGDEFAFIVPEYRDDADLAAIGERICSALRRPFLLPEATVIVAGSIGIAVSEPGSVPESLYDRADYALYQGKRGKRGQTTLFSASHDAQIHREARIEQALKSANLDGELSVVFQPIIRITDDSVAGFEALARWDSAVLGPMSPAEFIPVAERAGIIGGLTRPLIRTALATAATWPASVRLSFNLSAHDLTSDDGMMGLIGIIESSGIDPHRIDLEITETALSLDFDQVHRAVVILRRLGCGISLDDFGTGYSSLSRLHALPLNRLKIDRSFITDIDKELPGSKIVRSLLALSRDMGLECVLEGAETQAQLAAIRELGGELVQGFLFSPPVSPAETADVLARFPVPGTRDMRARA